MPDVNLNFLATYHTDNTGQGTPKRIMNFRVKLKMVRKLTMSYLTRRVNGE